MSQRRITACIARLRVAAIYVTDARERTLTERCHADEPTKLTFGEPQHLHALAHGTTDFGVERGRIVEIDGHLGRQNPSQVNNMFDVQVVKLHDVVRASCMFEVWGA